ncbi:MAG TPA: PilN domain-containing protein [Candidatus Saccharimonadia bacterium]|nr:PilN domain-containing protein [Candidatus Saccharimonadia bacterium]
MVQKARPIHLNLLPQDPFYETLPGRVLLWASTVGRYLVIFTELVVIISFATRFKLDRDLTDLNTRITQKVNLITSYGDLEAQVRTIQKKTEYLKQTSSALSSPDILALIASSEPKDVTLDSIQFRDTSVSFSGTALSSNSLAEYILALQANPKVSSVSVDQVKSAENGAPGFTFTMRLILKAQTARATPAPAAAPTTSDTGVTL